MLLAAEIALENAPCPMGCSAGETRILTGRDRLHGLPGEFTVVKCRGCGLMRTNPRPTRQAMAFYYPENYSPHQEMFSKKTGLGKNTFSWGKLALLKVFDTDSRKIPPLQPGRLLEIGCASGAFLSRMADRGWQVAGLETSSKAAEAARALGYSVRTGILEEFSDPEEPFDLIAGWQVLEHFHNPFSALQRLYRWIKPGGWLVLSVPDASAWEFRTFAEKWYALDLPRHLFHFTPATLKSMLARTGWKAERIFWHYNPNNLLQSLRYWCIDRGWNRTEGYLLDVVEGRRQRSVRLLLTTTVGLLHASGRMTVWATRT